MRHGGTNFGLRWDWRGQLARFAFAGAGPATVQWRLGTVRYRHQVVDAERLAASIAVELIAAGAEHRAASRAGVHFQEYVTAVLVVFDREAFEECVAVGAGGGIELLSHVSIMLYPLKQCQGDICKNILEGVKLPDNDGKEAKDIGRRIEILP